MKRIVAIILSLVICLGLSACGSKKSEEQLKAELKEEIMQELAEEANDEKQSAKKIDVETKTDENETKENEIVEEIVDAVAGIRPDFKKTMDEYEEFFNEYCDLLEAFENDPSNTELLMKYASFMGEYAEAEDALENFDTSDLNDAEMKYYIDVTARIEKRLLDVAY